MKAKVSACRVACTVTLVGALAFTVAAAAELQRDQEERGFYLGITGFRDQVSNLDFRLATSTVGGEGVSLELERSTEVRYDIGWLIPEQKGAFGITYWDYQESQDIEKSTPNPGFLRPTSFLSSPVTRARVEAGVHVLARSVDLAYSRDFKQSDNFHAAWILGLRYFRYEHRLRVLYSSTGSDLAIEEVESTGVGPRAGAGFQYDFTPRWGLGGSVGFATLFGDIDSGNVSVRSLGTVSQVIVFNETRNLSKTFSQVETDLHVSFLAWRTLDVRAGYRYAYWLETRARDLFGASDPFQTDDVIFDGPYLRVGYRF